jgi:hypothetical protein
MQQPGIVASAGEILEAVVSEENEEVGSSVGSDEPAEYGYDYALADERAVNALRKVVEREGFAFEPDFEPRAAPS